MYQRDRKFAHLAAPFPTSQDYAVDSSNPFSGAALEANRGGVLSDDQRRDAQRYARWRGGGDWARDAAEGVVRMAEGPIHKPKTDYDGDWQIVYVGALRLNVSLARWNATPEAGYVRAYYLPRKQWIVNLERLPDPPLPEGQQAIRRLWLDSVAALRSPDRYVSGVARATIAAIRVAAGSEAAANAVTPPAGPLDPRPLAEALCGTWSNLLVTLQFSADGTATVDDGETRTGRWWLDRKGRLATDVYLGPPTKAWVTADELIIGSGKGSTRTFKRDR